MSDKETMLLPFPVPQKLTDVSSVNNETDPNSIKRFTVERAMLPEIREDTYVYLLLDHGIPDVIINDYLLEQQKRNENPHTDEVYFLCSCLNTLLGQHRSIEDVSLNDIYTYFMTMHVKNGLNVRTVHNRIAILANLFEHFFFAAVKIHPSLIPGDNMLVCDNQKKRNQFTLITAISKRIIPSKKEADKYTPKSYRQYYTTDQVIAIYSELRKKSQAYATIFLDTVFLGHRIDMALSIDMMDLDLVNNTVIPSRSKTGQVHASVMPAFLVQEVQSYISNERNRIAAKTGSTCTSLFLNKRGRPVKYPSFRDALIKAAADANAKNPSLKIGKVRTHDGRATFATNLRSSQLEKQRLGEPTFSDQDFCYQMDWRNISNLEDYDRCTRKQETAPMRDDVYAVLTKGLRKIQEEDTNE